MDNIIYLKLIISNETGKPYTVNWDLKLNESFTIGRKRENSCVDLQIANIYLSNKQAKISNENNKLFIEDTSRGGTFISGHRIKKTQINNNAHIRFSSSLSLLVKY